MSGSVEERMARAVEAFGKDLVAFARVERVRHL